MSQYKATRGAMPKAQLYFEQRLVLENGLLRDIKVWKVPVTLKYPDGVRYHLVLVNPVSGKVLLLFDNHYPKGHHRHDRDDNESEYSYSNMTTLIQDYLKFETQEIRKNENNED